MDEAKEFHNLDDTSDGLFRELAPGVFLAHPGQRPPHHARRS
jgi:hypothetical protein